MLKNLNIDGALSELPKIDISFATPISLELIHTVKNFVQKIGEPTGSYGEFKIEKYELSDYLRSKDGELKWVIKGPTLGIYMGEDDIKHKFTKAGNYTISCFMGENACKEPLEIEVKQPKIKPETSKWIDKDSGSGNVIKKSGYGQTVCAYVEYEG